MTGRQTKDVAVTLEVDDLLWARLHGLNLSKLFSEHLKMIRRETEAATFTVLTTRRKTEPDSSPG